MTQKYSIPDGLRVYAIGDIHGCADLLRKMHETISMDLIDAPPENTHIVYLGDYIDRGPDSKAVVDALIERRDRGDGIPKSFIKGNHELALFEFLDNPVQDNWLSWGGLETLESYGITFKGGVPLPAEKEEAATLLKEKMGLQHLSFLEKTDLFLEIGDYVFVHAGVDPLKPIADSLNADNAIELTFIREPFLSWHENLVYEPLEKKIVHGHSIDPVPRDLPHRVGVDIGGYENGRLACAVLEGSDVRFLTTDEHG